MAGVGFALRQMLQQNNLTGVLRGYLYSVMVSSGYWIATVLILAFLHLFTSYYLGFTEPVKEFRAIIFYNFAFSLIISAPITVLVTRYLSDSVYTNNFNNTSGILIGSLLLLLGCSFPIPIIFYIFFAKMSAVTAFLAIVNFMIVTSIWLCMVFLTSLKYYTTVTWGIVIGSILAVASGTYLHSLYGEIGLLLGFNIGSAFILISLLASILASYSPKISEPFDLLPYFKKYWVIALGGLCYNLAIWIDKGIMLFAPEAEVLSNNLLVYPTYNTLMFLAYLTIIPVMASFVLNQETDFFEHYVRFYQGILEHNNYGEIQNRYQALLKSMRSLFYNAFLIQGVICIVTLIMAPAILEYLQISLYNIGTFRYAIIGASFQIITLFAIILLSYYDYQRGAVAVQIVFLCTNALFTLVTLKMGPIYYGLGYCLSAIVTFLVAGIILETYVNRLVYHTFITQNTSIAELKQTHHATSQ